MNLKKIFEAFPPPKFLNIPYAGLSIHDSAIRCIQFGKRGGKAYIEKYAEKPLSVGVITAGEVNNREELVKCIESIKKDLNLTYVKVSLPEEKAYLFSAKIPVVPEDDVRSAVESKIEENVPVPPGELIFDYKVVDTTQPDHLRVVVSNLPISVVDTYIDIITSAGLSPITLEIESQAITRALVVNDSKETVLIVNFGVDKVGLYVASNRIVYFTSTIQLKGNLGDNDEFLSHEIKKLYTYWHSLKENVGKEDKKIQEIVVCGENIPEGTVTYLSSHHSARVSLGNVWVNALDINANVPQIPFDESLKYAATVGLALPNKILI